jgi:hypothetical protein
MPRTSRPHPANKQDPPLLEAIMSDLNCIRRFSDQPGTMEIVDTLFADIQRYKPCSIAGQHAFWVAILQQLCNDHYSSDVIAKILPALDHLRHVLAQRVEQQTHEVTF